MKVLPKVLYFLCFIGLAAAAALTLNRSVQPSMSDILLRTVIAASLAGTPGLIHRKAWPAALVLLPLGAYLLMRTTLPLPDIVEGLGEQYGFYAEQLREGGAAYLDDIFPLEIGDVPGLRLLTAFSVYVVVGAASSAGPESAQGCACSRVPHGAVGLQPDRRRRRPGTLACRPVHDPGRLSPGAFARGGPVRLATA